MIFRCLWRVNSGVTNVSELHIPLSFPLSFSRPLSTHMSVGLLSREQKIWEDDLRIFRVLNPRTYDTRSCFTNDDRSPHAVLVMPLLLPRAIFYSSRRHSRLNRQVWNLHRPRSARHVFFIYTVKLHIDDFIFGELLKIGQVDSLTNVKLLLGPKDFRVHVKCPIPKRTLYLLENSSSR